MMKAMMKKIMIMTKKKEIRFKKMLNYVRK